MNQISQITLIGFLLLFFNCNRSEQELLLHESVIYSQEHSTQLISVQNKAMLNHLQLLLGEESKKKYLPIHYALDTLCGMTAAMKQYIKSVKRNEFDSNSFVDRLSSLELDIKTHLRDFLLKNQDTLGIHDRVFEEKMHALTKVVAITKNMPPPVGINQLSDSELELLRSKTLLKLEIVDEEIIISLLHLIGGGCRIYYPLPKVLPISPSTAKGESFEALIFYYDDYFDHQIPILDHITVDGVPLPIINGKYAYYKSAPINCKEKRISIWCSSHNEVTGNRYEARNEYFHLITTQ